MIRKNFTMHGKVWGVGEMASGCLAYTYLGEQSELRKHWDSIHAELG